MSGDRAMKLCRSSVNSKGSMFFRLNIHLAFGAAAALWSGNWAVAQNFQPRADLFADCRSTPQVQPQLFLAFIGTRATLIPESASALNGLLRAMKVQGTIAIVIRTFTSVDGSSASLSALRIEEVKRAIKINGFDLASVYNQALPNNADDLVKSSNENEKDTVVPLSVIPLGFGHQVHLQHLRACFQQYDRSCGRDPGASPKDCELAKQSLLANMD